MIIIDDDATADDAAPLPPAVAARHLLAACAAELARQAAALAALDASLGEVGDLFAGHHDGAAMGHDRTATLMRALQQVDRLRQESAGVGGVLGLVCDVAAVAGEVPVAAVQEKAGMRDLQARLLRAAQAADRPCAGPTGG